MATATGLDRAANALAGWIVASGTRSSRTATSRAGLAARVVAGLACAAGKTVVRPALLLRPAPRLSSAAQRSSGLAGALAAAGLRTAGRRRLTKRMR